MIGSRMDGEEEELVMRAELPTAPTLEILPNYLEVHSYCTASLKWVHPAFRVVVAEQYLM